MTVLNYSSFMQLIKAHYSYAVANEDLARELLQEITSPDIHDKYSSTYLSYIWNGERQITSEVKDEVEKKVNQQRCLQRFEDVIYPELSTHSFEDFLTQLEILITNDATISAAKKQSLLAQCREGNYAKYLTNVFLYAIKKDNKNSVTSIGVDDVELLQQVNQECPLCHTPLIASSRGKTIYRYAVSHIFPEIFPADNESEFTEIHKKPTNISDVSNKICLCDNCAMEYLLTPSIETYDKLYRIKWSSLHHSGLRKASDKVRLDEKITQILSNIKETDIDSIDFSAFRMKPLKIKQKIAPTNKTLMKAIKDDNDAYYFFIKEYLSQQDTIRGSFKKIALEVQLCFTELAEKTTDQDEIYNALIQWILDTQHLSDYYRTAAHIVISFFVQNCEVFDELPE